MQMRNEPVIGATPAFTVNVILFPPDKGDVHPFAFVIEVIVTVVEPELARALVLNVPLVPEKTIVATLPEEELAPLTLYTTLNVPLPRVVEFTVIVTGEPEHAADADGTLKLETAGGAFTVVVFDAAVAPVHPDVL